MSLGEEETEGQGLLSLMSQFFVEYLPLLHSMTV